MFIRMVAFITLAVGLTVFGASAEAGCSRASVSGGDQAVPASKINQKLLDALILAEVNYQRCRHGRPKLVAASGLRKVAAGHSKWMAGAQKITHKSTASGRRSVLERLKKSGVKFSTGSENIGMLHYYQLDGLSFKIRNASACEFSTYGGAPLPRHTYKSLAQSAVDYWMSSSKHRTNILNRKVRMFGSGAWVNRNAEYCGTVYLTQNFAG